MLFIVGNVPHKSVGELPTHNHTASTNTLNINGGFDINDGANIGSAWGVFSKNEAHVWAKGDNENVGKGVNFNSNHTHIVTINNTGSNQPHNNIQPYISVYMWKRTA